MIEFAKKQYNSLYLCLSQSLEIAFQS